MRDAGPSPQLWEIGAHQGACTAHATAARRVAAVGERGRVALRYHCVPSAAFVSTMSSLQLQGLRAVRSRGKHEPELLRLCSSFSEEYGPLSTLVQDADGNSLLGCDFQAARECLRQARMWAGAPCAKGARAWLCVPSR